MSKKRKPRMPDPAEFAFGIMQRIAGETMPESETPIVDENPKVRAGRAGGKKGGVARMKQLTAAQRKALAKKAAAARWE